MFVAGVAARAQTPIGASYQPPNFHPPGSTSMNGSRAIQAVFLSPMGIGAENPYVDAHGNPVVVPASYCGDGLDCGDDCYYGGDCPYGDDGAYGDGSYYGDDGYCGADGSVYPNAHGSDHHLAYKVGRVCGNSNGQFCNGGTCPNAYARGTNPPFNEYVENYSLLPPHRTEQCGPHYFDVRMEAVFLTRDETFAQEVDFTSLNVAGPIVLSSGQLDFGLAAGFRILGRYDVGPLSVVEFGYTGVEGLDSSASFTDPDPVDPTTGTGNLYSLFTDFVRDPLDVPATVTNPGGALPWTERSITHRISLETELHTGEFNYRRYWVGFWPRLSGTFLAGFRFTRLREDFSFFATGEAQGQYLTIAKNDLTGFQTGGDVWLHLMQGLRAGTEIKVGVFDNHYKLSNTFTTFDDTGTATLVSDYFEKDIPAFISEASVDIVADVLPSWSIRAGYEVQFLNSLVLAGENFNTGTVYGNEPGVLLPARVPFFYDQGHALYHGFHVGAEYIW